ncbi:NAD(P)-binding protein [Pluteus cervinus]|uniref:NAD(P)-binding protein n=1 Tax=Pluteus cervinus TaxID=181527 RepID=A0ACD3AJH2_9AGAR|nr:NAD(P)-binding protein [Pluteus cervinus]
MTYPFTTMSLLVLTAKDVEKLIASFDPEELVELMKQVFITLSSQTKDDPQPKIYQPQRLLVPTANHTALFMPARWADSTVGGTSIKTVCVPRSKEDSRGIPGSTLVLDEETGVVKAVVNARSLTALRNAAGSLLSTKLVGLKLPQRIVAFGAGKQIEAHLDLHVRSYPSIRHCTIVNRRANERVDKLVQLLRIRFSGVTFDSVVNDAEKEDSNSDREVVKDTLSKAGIVICATPSTMPLFPSSWIPNGTHVILIGSYTPQMQEVDRDLIWRAIPSSTTNSRSQRQVLLVDSTEACAKEAGELIRGGISVEQVVEIGEYASQHVVPDERSVDVKGGNDGPVTVFKSVGVGVQDVAIACAVVRRAEALGVGTTIEGYDEV